MSALPAGSAAQAEASTSQVVPLKPRLKRLTAKYGGKARKGASATAVKPTGKEADRDSDDFEELREPPRKRVNRASKPAFDIPRDSSIDDIDSNAPLPSTLPQMPNRTGLVDKSNLITNSLPAKKGKQSVAAMKMQNIGAATLARNLHTASPHLAADHSVTAGARIAISRIADLQLPGSEMSPSPDIPESTIAMSTPALHGRVFSFDFPDLHAPVIRGANQDPSFICDPDQTYKGSPVHTSTPFPSPDAAVLRQTDLRRLSRQSSHASTAILPGGETMSDGELAGLLDQNMALSDTSHKGKGKSAAQVTYLAGQPQTSVTAGRSANVGIDDVDEDGFASDEATQELRSQERRMEEKAHGKKQEISSKLLAKGKAKSRSKALNTSKSSMKDKKERASRTIDKKDISPLRAGSSGGSRKIRTEAKLFGKSRVEVVVTRGSKGSMIRNTPVKANSSASGDEIGL